ncbi:hypothetical protein [Pseudosulfitobacter pseudonitzschiae]|uniref:hypothetical protein n=1 Tax=Pseudosulfitobacter pseudonitzschiae TaxID=1402135 RepID=UPI003B7C2B62
MSEYPASYDIHNIANVRAFDAMIHEVFFGAPLWLTRGPFFDGLPVPKYFSDEGASFALLRKVLPDADITLSMSPADGVTMISLDLAELLVDVRQPGLRAAPLLAVACLEGYLMQTRGMTRDRAVEWVTEALEALEAPPTDSEPPTLLQNAPQEA